MNDKLLDFIKNSPTAYHAVSNAADELDMAGYTRLCESEKWQLEAGHGYYVVRGGSSLISFRIPTGEPVSFMIGAAHCDSPSFKLRENPVITGASARLSVEKYGGMLCATWMDRPLGIAGRVTVRAEDGIRICLVDLPSPAAVIPSVAIHMNRNANSSASYDPAVDMLPVYCKDADADRDKFLSDVADAAGVSAQDILSFDLFLYCAQDGYVWNDYICAPRLDDLQCAYVLLRAFTHSEAASAVPVLCLFDNEEVGSQTKQGAASTFLCDVLERICICENISREKYMQMIANSFMVSCDNAQAVHPNHPELSDKNQAVYMNGGVVIKYNANQNYTTDAVSAAMFRLICETAGVPVQCYANRADIPGGSTLGNIANTKVSLNTVDVGIAQLAMHSAYETSGAADCKHLYNAMKLFFEKAILADDGGLKLI